MERFFDLREPLLAVAVLAALPAPARDDAGASPDWPQFLGPRRNGEYLGPSIASSWPEGGPRIVWKRDVGQGFSGPVVSGAHLVLFHRIGGEELLECLDAGTGETRWSLAYPTRYRDRFGFDEGPRATPLIHDGTVYSFGAVGVLSATDLPSGRKIWRVDTHERFEPPESFFGAACSPLVQGGRVLVSVGGQKTVAREDGARGSGIVAFDAETGDVVWTATRDEAGYASPVLATLDGKEHAVFFTREGLVVLDPADGSVRHQRRWRARMHSSVNAATPLIAGDRIFVSASYGTGALALAVQGGEYEELWSGDGILSNHYATSVHRDDYLYGFDGRQEYGAKLRCVALETGEVKWTEASPGREKHGSGTLILAGDKILILTDAGELVLASARSERFEALARAKPFSREVRAHAALASGYLYARDESTLLCLDMAQAGTPVDVEPPSRAEGGKPPQEPSRR